MFSPFSACVPAFIGDHHRDFLGVGSILGLDESMFAALQLFLVLSPGEGQAQVGLVENGGRRARQLKVTGIRRG